VLLVRNKKEDKKVRSSETLVLLVTMMVALALIGVAVFNPCSLSGHHDPMAPAEYGCANGANWTAALTLCRADIQVCRRCKLVYLSRVEAGTEKKP
jgi:hypothetical protein